MHAIEAGGFATSAQTVLRAVFLRFLEHPSAERPDGWARLLPVGADQPIAGFDVDHPGVGLDQPAGGEIRRYQRRNVTFAQLMAPSRRTDAR